MKKNSSLMNIKKVSAFALLLGSICLAGCNPTNEDNSSSSEEVPPTPSEYYNPDNFITPQNAVTESKLVTYDGPSRLESSKKVSIKANGTDLFVYETRVNHGRVFTWVESSDYTQAVIFDFEGKVHLDVTITEEVVTSALLRPLVYGITPSFNEHTISFDLTSSGNYVLEYNEKTNEAIQIFANPLEKETITKEEVNKDPNMIYVGPGIYDAGAFPIKDNTTIYLAGGSYVYGQFSAEGVSNVTIKGRGIVSGSIYNRRSANEYTIPVVMRKVNHLTIEDVTFFDPAGWALHLWKCDDVKVNNVKIITARSNGDGISIQSCSNVEVSGGYVRTWDDALVVKNSDLGTTSNINIHDVVVWSDLAQCMEVGYETYGATMDNITFQDISVVHAFHKAVISLHNCDQAKITNVTYKNITVEDCQTLGDDRNDGENDFLIDFTIAYNEEWTKSEGKRGSVDGINIENVKVYNKTPSVIARMRGEDNSSLIENVKIKGVEIGGKQIKSAEDLGLVTNDYVKNVTFENQDKVLGSYIHLPYSLNLSNNEVKQINNKNISQDGLIVPDFAKYEGDPAFIGTKNPVQITASSSHGAGAKATTVGDDGTGDFLAPNSSASNAIDENKSTSYKASNEWKNEEDEFATLTLEFASPINVGVIRIFGEENNDYSLIYSISIFCRKKKSDGSWNDKYTRLKPAAEYKMTPANGNLIDINITSQEYMGIQLRFVRLDSIQASKNYAVSEVEFYSPSLAYMKSIVDSTAHNDVYPVSNIVDGETGGTSYYESKGLPALIVIDLEDVYKLSRIVLSLPPSIVWSARTQNIEVSVSNSSLKYDSKETEFNIVKQAKDYLFDPQTGNRVILDMDNVECRFLKIVINSNDASGGYGGQLSEVAVYGVK